MTYLIDTDWAVDYLKGIDEKVEFLQQEKELYVSTLTVGELVEGIEDSERKEERMESLEDFLSGVTLLSFTKETAIEFGKIRNNLRKQGNTIGDIDTMIAATAKVHNLEILTDNTQHFQKVEDLQLHNQS
ncbi:MAG: type II toxin-antitoxin system VapC family toxin [Candidatus Nanohaloarchaea archaeon]